MTTNQLRLLGVALLLATVVAAMHFARSGDPADGVSENRAAADATVRKQRLERSDARAKARLEQGAYVVRSKQISSNETIETVIIPEGLSDEFDTRCVVYRDVELRTSAITCTGILFRQPLPSS